MLILKEKEKCPYGDNCAFNKDEACGDGICEGLNPGRESIFKCAFVKQDEDIKLLQEKRSCAE
jgi:hypothetical protein